MSIEAIKAVLTESRSSHAARLLAIALANHANDDGTKAYPGLEVLKDETKLSRSALYGAVAELKDLGEVEEIGKVGRATHYRLLLPSLVQNLESAVQDLDDGVQILDGFVQILDEEPSGNRHGTVKQKVAPKVTVGRHRVTSEEWDVASRAIEVFNECNGGNLALVGTRGSGTESLKRIVERIREHPELNADDHERIVRANFAAPWWSDDRLGGVGPIYGPKVFEQAMVNDGTPKNRPGERRRFRAERDPNEGPVDW